MEVVGLVQAFARSCFPSRSCSEMMRRCKRSARLLPQLPARLRKSSSSARQASEKMLSPGPLSMHVIQVE
jgi:hypothetical protein